VSFLLKLIPGGKTARLALGIALLAGISWLAHFVYTWYRTTNSVTVSPASVGLALNSADDEEAYTALTMTSMQPGANDYVGVTVANTGPSDFWFTMSSTASGDGSLDSDLRVGVAAVPAGSCTSSGYAAGTSLHRDTRGLSGASIAAQPLAAGDSEYLCLHIQLPLAVPKSLEGRSAQDTLNFTAEQ
jgi:hypothetical protein